MTNEFEIGEVAQIKLKSCAGMMDVIIEHISGNEAKVNVKCMGTTRCIPIYQLIKKKR